MISQNDLEQKIKWLEQKFEEHDKNSRIIFETIRQLLEPAPKPSQQIGFHP